MNDEETNETLNRYAVIVEDVAKELVKTNGMGPRELIAVLGVALVRANFQHAKDGRETSALEDAFRFMRGLNDGMVADYVKSQREDAEAIH